MIYRISVAATLKFYDKSWFGLSGQTSILATATAALIDLLIILLLNKINPPGWSKWHDERERQTDRQTDRQTQTHRDGQRQRQTETHSKRIASRQVQTKGESDWQTDMKTDMEKLVKKV